jgi:putative FmdB family regulatory protein
MPTYEYACSTCGEHLEVVQSFKDEPLSTCPACQGPLRKVFSPIGVVFKGSGFYKTDSRTSASGATTSKDSGGSTASAASASSSDSGSSSTSSGAGGNSSSTVAAAS